MHFPLDRVDLLQSRGTGMSISATPRSFYGCYDDDIRLIEVLCLWHDIKNGWVLFLNGNSDIITKIDRVASQ